MDTPSVGNHTVSIYNILGTAVLALSLCAVCPAISNAEEARFADLPGIWRMHGYGRVFDISAERVVSYDITDVSCLQRKETPLREAQTQYERITRSTDRFTAFEAGGITRYTFERLAALPDRCRYASSEPLTDPELNFWVLWHAFRENYAFFDLRRVNWDDIYARFRPKITAATTQDDLFEIFSRMLAALNDRHVDLVAAGRSFNGGRRGALYESWVAENSVADSQTAADQYRKTVSTFVVDDVLRRKVQHGANGILTWGWAAPGVGYVNVTAMYTGLASATPLPTQIALIDEAMTRVIAELGRAKALIVDARFSTGGYDAVALRIIGYLTHERRLAFTKKAVEGGGYTDTQEVYFEPQGKRQFTGPVYYLQSDYTVSAAEIFSLAMMALPNVTRVGTPTYGVLSDSLEKQLPNGWSIGLSNEVYVAVDGNLYEGRGIPPNIVVTPTPGSFHERMRLDIDTALALIGKANTKRASP
jgi:carboxyl-terminal processing protease